MKKMNKKKEIRANFRKEVFTRDNDKCRKCNEPAIDAHHITDRHFIPNGGYVKENGISLCSECHEKAELYHEIGITELGYHPDDLYEIIGSSKELAIECSKNLK
jgi:5-methylcytosine-specific restriction endonuclease McrA